jgi:carboxypeptidase Taq
MKDNIDKLKMILNEITDLESINSLLGWDQSTYMPQGGAPARGRQISLLAKIIQEKSISKELGTQIDNCEKILGELVPESDDAALIKIARRNYEKATKIPPTFLAKLTAHMFDGYQTWTVARQNNDFDLVRPILEKTLDLSRELANFFPGYDHIADPLIDFSDYGMKTNNVKEIFSALQNELVPLVKSITEKKSPDNNFMFNSYPESLQIKLGERIIKSLGYDFSRGRQDKTPHPFMTKFSLSDVRITTRFNDNDLSDGLFSTIHEAGHAMYEQGINLSYEGLPLAGGTSSGIHESQSRLWENIVGRSREFWNVYLPEAKEIFPDQLKNVNLEQFYKGINKVSKSLIRVDADEVTYNLHVMIRFDLEIAMLEGKLSIKDLPDAWHGRYQSDLGMQAPTNVDGVMQDVHWYAGTIGGSFQGYTLGNIMSSQFYNAALKAHPSIPNDISIGNFQTLYGWMKDNIYTHGTKYTANELLQRATKSTLDIAPYINYLKTKFGDLYNL